MLLNTFLIALASLIASFMLAAACPNNRVADFVFEWVPFISTAALCITPVIAAYYGFTSPC